MAKNKLMDLNDALFAQLERLGDEDMSGDAMMQEIERSKAVASIAKEIVNTGKLALDAQRKTDSGEVLNKPRMLELGPSV